MKTLEDKVRLELRDHNSTELALGWLRYEAVRKLTARRFKELCERNLKDGVPFDDLVDELIMGDK